MGKYSTFRYSIIHTGPHQNGQKLNISIFNNTHRSSSKWASTRQTLRTQQSHAKHVVHIFVCTSRTLEKLLKLSRRCTSGRLTGECVFLLEDYMINCLPFSLPNITDPGLHRKLWSGFSLLKTIDAN